MNIINPYRFGGATGLLDQYSGAAAAFSVRELTSAWAGQAVIRVERSSDSAQADFTAAELEGTDVKDWVGTGGTDQGYVVTWYDQSGNGFDATQTAANAPKVITNGSYFSLAPREIYFSGSRHLTNTTGGTSGNGNIDYNGGVSWYMVHNLANTNGRLWCDDITGSVGYTIFPADGNYLLNDNDTGYEGPTTGAHGTTGTHQLASFHFDSLTGDYEYARDGSNTTGNLSTWSDVAIDSSNTANFGFGHAGNGGGSNAIIGFVQELIIYPNDQSANRTGIEGNINDYYGIYV